MNRLLVGFERKLERDGPWKTADVILTLPVRRSKGLSPSSVHR